MDAREFNSWDDLQLARQIARKRMSWFVLCCAVIVAAVAVSIVLAVTVHTGFAALTFLGAVFGGGLGAWSLWDAFLADNVLRAAVASHRHEQQLFDKAVEVDQ